MGDLSDGLSHGNTGHERLQAIMDDRGWEFQ